MLSLVLLFLIAYIIGSFPTAIITGRLLQKIDIREHGSGNAGATNVFRVLGWKAGLGVLIFDMFKGFVPVFWIAGLFAPSVDALIYYEIIAAVGAIIGHVWTLFAGFKGGKGVGTSAGVFLALAPLPLIIALISFIIVVAWSRYVSLGSILAALIFLIVLLLQKFIWSFAIPDPLLYLVIAVVVLIWIAHRGNIKRLITGTENKLSFGNASKDTGA